MEKSQMQLDREARYKEYCDTYAEQLRLMGFVKSLETDNEHIRGSEIVTGRQKRRAKKLIKINDKDIKKYNKMLSTMPEVPPFK